MRQERDRALSRLALAEKVVEAARDVCTADEPGPDYGTIVQHDMMFKLKKALEAFDKEK